MNRCKDCAGLIYGDDSQCASCRHNEWKDQIDKQRMIREARLIIQEIHEAQTKKRRFIMNTIHNVFIFGVLIVLLAGFIDATKTALEYELRKPEILRQHGVK